MRKLIFLCVCIPFFSFAQLKINEIMPCNVSAVLDDAYNYSIWAEIYNAGASNIDLSTYYFTDNRAEPRKWRPPTRKIVAAGGFTLVWFEHSGATGHATFKLEPNGGKLYLINSTLQIEDSISYPRQYRNTSYGRATDGAEQWLFFEEFSAGASNNGKKSAAIRCAVPRFSLTGGVYATSQTINFANPATGDSIFYTTNGAEPTSSSIKYVSGTSINLSTTAIIRARTFSATKLPSDIVSQTYFINDANVNHQGVWKLPIVSIITEQKNLTDNTIGIYVKGTNGITGNGMNEPANWNRPWDRPANFELYDTTRTQTLNQELDISIAGGWTRMEAQKSLKINPKKKFGTNKINYNLFPETKPNLKIKSIMLRNSGNDFKYSMMRDGFMQSLVMKRMNLDYLAYEPAVLYINGEYYGIQNIRERSDEDFVYSNYGLDEDEIMLLESTEMGTAAAFVNLTNYVKNNNIVSDAIYNNVCQMIDIDNFTDYFLTQIFLRNTDWPHNNIKVWKAKNGGKWRWVLYDTDFGYNLWDNNHTHNTLSWALGELGGDPSWSGNEWSIILLKRLLQNATFRKHFINRFCIQISSTFEYNRSCHILDSVAAKIQNEIVFHKNKWGSDRDFANDISIMKNFAANRPASMLGFLSSRYFNNAATATIHISTNHPKAAYLFNNETITDNSIKLKYFKNQPVTLKADSITGYTFHHWETGNLTNKTPINYGSGGWKYFDGNDLPANNWFSNNYTDNHWNEGVAPLGYTFSNIATTISYGGNAQNKYPTAYFRKTFTINDLDTKNDFALSVYFDDGVVVYVNGVEVGRGNMPYGEIAYNTWSSTFNNGDYATFNIPKSLLVEGENLVAAEVHQINATSSDLIFDLELTHTVVSNVQNVSVPVYSATLINDFAIRAIYEEKKDEEENAVNEHFTLSTIEVFPTLVSDNLFIKNAENEQVTFIDIMGKTLKTFHLKNNIEVIPLQDLQQGIYIVCIGKERFRLVKM